MKQEQIGWCPGNKGFLDKEIENEWETDIWENIPKVFRLVIKYKPTILIAFEPQILNYCPSK